MRRMLATLALVAATTPAAGQHSDDEAAVKQVVVDLFDAMRAKDSVRLRSVFHPGARLQRTGRNRSGELIVGNTPIDRFVTSIMGAQGHLDEQIWDVEVRVSDDLATVWNKYAFFFNEQFSHCGFDAFQLARTADGWKIIQVADTQRRGEEHCEMPPDHH